MACLKFACHCKINTWHFNKFFTQQIFQFAYYHDFNLRIYLTYYFKIIFELCDKFKTGLTFECCDDLFIKVRTNMVRPIFALVPNEFPLCKLISFAKNLSDLII